MVFTIARRRTYLYACFLSLLLLIACGGGSNNFPNDPVADPQSGTTTPDTEPPVPVPEPPPAAPPSGSDTEAPHVHMLLPAQNDALTGTAPIVADANDNVGVTSVQFLVDDKLLGLADTASPYWLQFDTSYLSDGAHSFSARASDAAGNHTTATSHTVTIGNSCKTASPALTPWQNTPFTVPNSILSAQWDITPLEAGMNAALGLAQNDATGFASLATEVRFNSDNTIDARNGGVYQATSIVSYQPNQAFHIRMEVNLTSRTYSVFVTPTGGAELALAIDFAFRTEQQGVSALDRWAVGAEGGALKVCGANIVGNNAPVADAGADRTVAPGVLVSLAGSASTDSDGSIVSYQWQQTAGTSVTLTGATNSIAFFTAPDTFLVNQALEFQLTVTDDRGATASDIVVITVQPAPMVLNTVPTAKDRNFVSFDAPEVDSDMTLTFQLAVTHTYDAMGSDSVEAVELVRGARNRARVARATRNS